MSSADKLLMALFGVVSASPATACTLCHSDTAAQVRAAIFDVDFWSNASAVISPIPVLAAAIMVMAKLSR